jgi:putative membrane protein
VKGFIASIVAGGIAFLLVAQVLPASMIDLRADLVPQGLIVALVVGVVNAVIKPIVKVLSLPISLLTLGLSGFVINGALLMAVAWGVREVAGIDLLIGGWPKGGITADTLLGAVVASALLSVITAVVGLAVKD